MKPQIFISSTFYDLKYIREDLENFVKSHDYEPLMFENGDIGYIPGNSLDISCYEAVKNSDMSILIIGSEYGSAANGEKKDLSNEYISVTRNEFRTAINANIPVFVMIDKKVMTEYEIYDANYNSIEIENRKMKFPTTKNINVFRFIKEVKSIKNLPIQEFEKSADIKKFIGKQWADMFKNYLHLLRKENYKLKNPAGEMEYFIPKTNMTSEKTDKSILSEKKQNCYDNIINQQEILSFCDALVKRFKFKCNIEQYPANERIKFISIMINCLNETYVEEWDKVGENLYNSLRLSNHKIHTIQHNEKYNKIIINKLNLIHNESSRNKIIETMCSDEYFNRLFY